MPKPVLDIHAVVQARHREIARLLKAKRTDPSRWGDEES